MYTNTTIVNKLMKVITNLSIRWSYANVRKTKRINCSATKYSLNFIAFKSCTCTLVKNQTVVETAHTKSKAKFESNDIDITVLIILKISLFYSIINRSYGSAYVNIAISSCIVYANHNPAPCRSLIKQTLRLTLESIIIKIFSTKHIMAIKLAVSTSLWRYFKRQFKDKIIHGINQYIVNMVRNLALFVIFGYAIYSIGKFLINIIHSTYLKLKHIWNSWRTAEDIK